MRLYVIDVVLEANVERQALTFICYTAIAFRSKVTNLQKERIVLLLKMVKAAISIIWDRKTTILVLVTLTKVFKITLYVRDKTSCCLEEDKKGITANVF